MTYLIDITTPLTGTDLRNAREEMGLTREDLAYLMDVTSQTVIRWERPDTGLVTPAVAYTIRSMVRSMREEGLTKKQMRQYVRSRFTIPTSSLRTITL